MHRTLLVALASLVPAVALAAQAPTPVEAELIALEAVSQELATLAPETCEGVLDGTLARLHDPAPSPLRPADAAAHPDALSTLWTVQRQSWHALRDLHEAGSVPEGCVDGFRRLDVALRSVADQLVLASVAPSPWLVTEELASFDDLRSGDVLVTRGGLISSAGIAHIGAVPSSFSHNALVHVDHDGDAWTVEAYLEKGALVQPLASFLEHGVGRVTVVRYEDPALAARAAELAHSRITAGPAIGYDEAFDSDDHGELFCSEIVPWAFALAGGPADLPLHRTRFDHAATPDLFAGMGIEVPDLAAPADLLFDPRFHVVGSWRDLEALPELGRQALVVGALFDHLEATGRAPVPTWTHRATVDVGLRLRRMPVLNALVKERLHPDGDRQFLVAALALQDAGQQLYDGAYGRTPEASGDEAQRTLATMLGRDDGRGVHRVVR